MLTPVRRSIEAQIKSKRDNIFDQKGRKGKKSEKAPEGVKGATPQTLERGGKKPIVRNICRLKSAGCSR